MIKGKTIIITGAAGVIGRETARVFNLNGANVFLVDKDVKNLHQTQPQKPPNTTITFHIQSFHTSPKHLNKNPTTSTPITAKTSQFQWTNASRRLRLQ